MVTPRVFSLAPPLTLLLIVAACEQTPAFVEKRADLESGLPQAPGNNYPNGVSSEDAVAATTIETETEMSQEELDALVADIERTSQDGASTDEASSPRTSTHQSATSGSGSEDSAEDGSSGGGGSGSTGSSGSTSSGIQWGDGDPQGAVLSLTLPLTDELSTDEEESVTSETQPVSIYFLLDVTGSMSWVIDTVKNNITTFADSLAANSIPSRLGVVSFRDGVTSTLPLTDDVNAFKTHVSSLIAVGGGDSNEASLLAIQTAVDLLEAETSSDSTKIIFVVTDNPGHYGPTPRDCSLTPVTTHIASASPALRSQLKIFHSVPDSGAACSGFISARTQMNQLLSEILPEVPLANRGGALPFPFDGTTLLDTFVEEIVRVTSTTVDLSCFVTDATLKALPPEGGAIEVAAWHAADVRSAINHSVAEESAELSRTLVSEDMWVYHSTFDLDISRCCVTADVVAAGGAVTECRKNIASSVVGVEVMFHD